MKVYMGNTRLHTHSETFILTSVMVIVRRREMELQKYEPLLVFLLLVQPRRNEFLMSMCNDDTPQGSASKKKDKQ